MKTLEEVKAHMDKVGYNQLAIQKIEGFLFGYGLLGEEFEMEYMIGQRDFDDFITWFNSEEKKKSEIDWNEFGFGDFIHVKKGVDVVLLGGINGCVSVGYNGEQVVDIALTNESRPCNEGEIDMMIRRMNAHGLDFCFVDNEFKPCPICYSYTECKKDTETSKENAELKNSYEELCKIAESMSDDNPFKCVAKTIVGSLGEMVDEVKEAEKRDSELIDELEIKAKGAIENIIANIHAGTMGETERENVISTLKCLVELGNMYE